MKVATLPLREGSNVGPPGHEKPNGIRYIDEHFILTCEEREYLGK